MFEHLKRAFNNAYIAGRKVHAGYHKLSDKLQQAHAQVKGHIMIHEHNEERHAHSHVTRSVANKEKGTRQAIETHARWKAGIIARERNLSPDQQERLVGILMNKYADAYKEKQERAQFRPESSLKSKLGSFAESHRDGIEALSKRAAAVHRGMRKDKEVITRKVKRSGVKNLKQARRVLKRIQVY